MAPGRVNLVLSSTLAFALEYWGGDWDHLRGTTITFEANVDVSCNCHAGAFGCCDGIPVD